MDPNSANQRWSRWTATVTPPEEPSRVQPTYEQARENCARFYRKAFGSPTELHITRTGRTWTIDCRTEGHPAHDSSYIAYMTNQLQRFLLQGFGQRAQVNFEVALEAGSREDGSPPDQLIIGPEPVVLDNRLLRER